MTTTKALPYYDIFEVPEKEAIKFGVVPGFSVCYCAPGKKVGYSLGNFDTYEQAERVLAVAEYGYHLMVPGVH